MSLKSLCFIVITYLVQAGCFATYCMDDLSLEEKVGQLLLVHFNGKEVNDDAKTLIQSNYVGGFIYYNWANGLSSPKQVYTLSLNLQQLTQENRRSIPLFIALDQEGGAVNRLSKGFTIFPGNRALSMASDPKLATLNAFASGKELLAVGVNMNLAPVVDINSNPKNPVIGIRSFGNLTEDFLLFANNMIDGYHQAGIITSLKH
ncbi:MAG: beta-N-acetylhexosaminidase, partial [Chlamydiales bacterium]|nr:beta-N-acetylhexosaminidase [Chlamydiales bacterium]